MLSLLAVALVLIVVRCASVLCLVGSFGYCFWWVVVVCGFLFGFASTWVIVNGVDYLNLN